MISSEFKAKEYVMAATLFYAPVPESHLQHFGEDDLKRLAKAHRVGPDRAEVLMLATKLARQCGKKGITFRNDTGDWTLSPDSRVAVPAIKYSPWEEGVVCSYDALCCISVCTAAGATVRLLKGSLPTDDGVIATAVAVSDDKESVQRFPDFTHEAPLGFITGEWWGCRVVSTHKILEIKALGIRYAGY